MDASDRRRCVAEEAAEWWLVLRGEASRPQREQYVDWLRESSSHVAEMLRVAQVHGALAQFERWSGIQIDESRPSNVNVVRLADDFWNSNPRQSSSTGRLRRRMAVAAAILLTAVAAIMLQLRSNDLVIHTERGERREVSLADGSVVQIDPETRLRVNYAEHVRRVVLVTGRALFHVAKNPQRPFLVEANETTVRAVGTAFAVERNRSDSLLVTVSEGTVAVFPTPLHFAGVGPRSAPGSVERPHLSERAHSHLLVTAGQQVAVGGFGSPETVQSVDSGRALAWAEGRLIFDNSTVADAVLQFNRYNRIQIIVNDESLAHRSINGTFNAADPESFAAFMQSVARVRIGRNERADITVDALN